MKISKIFQVMLLIVSCHTLVLSALAGEGSTLDGYTIRVSKGPKPADPNILAKGEKGTFNFTVSLSHNGTHIEEVPPSMTLVYLVTSPEDSKITKVEPATYVFPPNGEQYSKTKIINSKIDSAVSVEVDFLDLTGTQTVTLRVSPHTKQRQSSCCRFGNN
ncbi:MAG: hypothetical protein LBJ67_00135 [Planctomycetaceae bacterium]|jgi:hypothetical protein|nr:hypothetical protein [Planctomycetaceae bacterium]